MAEKINDRRVFSLLEVTLSIQKTIAERYTTSFWVKAEMNKLNHYSHSGHCYPELVEKKEGKVIALIKSNLWKSDFLRINERFRTILKEPLKDGITILFCATVSFDPTHGLSLRIIDIDPSFSLGELEREKQETIERLSTEGLFNNNKKLKLALLPQRIAIISVETSKGYADYLKVIEQNPWGYKFMNLLFPSLLQGEKSVLSIINQLQRIKKVSKHFDAVAIIRGGGGDVGLSSYNNYDLAKEVATFPLPVFTGIGHSTNETVTEMVSFQNAITPTELADFLIQKFHNFAVPVKKAQEIILDRSNRILKDEKLKFHTSIKYFQSVITNRLQKSESAIRELSTSVTQTSRFRIKQESQLLTHVTQSLKKTPSLLLAAKKNSILQRTTHLQQQASTLLNSKKQLLQNLEKNVHILDPVNILRRGFTITMAHGKAIKSIDDVNPEDTITTILADGEILSDVKKLKKPD
jgi:exodeoxyribonuclease VII large subunit